MGSSKDNITVDPGIGFAKRFEDNIAIIKNIESFKKIGYPVLIGYSGKSFLGTITNKETEDRLSASLSAGIMSALYGADILRVHDVGETSDALKVLNALKTSGD